MQLIVIGLIIALLAVLILSASSWSKMDTAAADAPVSKRRIDFEEPFLPPLVNGPGNADLVDPRKPYALLEHLPTLNPMGPSQVNSQTCRTIDFARNLEISNYGQMTNNYRHEFPDSCSAPFQETVLSLYKPEVLRL